MKIALRVFLGLLVLLILAGVGGYHYFKNQFLSASPSRLTVAATASPIPFTWSAAQLGDHYEPHNALFLPVQVAGLEQPFRMQFDLGAPSSVLYGPAFQSVLDSTGLPIAFVDNESRRYAQNVAFNIADASVTASEMRVMAYGEPVGWGAETPPIIGTIGADFISGKIGAIDFPNQTIRLFDQLPASMQDASFVPFSFQGRRVILPIEVDGKTVQAMYDSGSSAFGLLTTEENLARWGAGETFSYDVNSWGQKVPAHNRASQHAISIGGADVPLQRVSYLEWPNKWQARLMSLSNMGAMLGNMPFLESMLVLDTQTQQFAVLPSTPQTAALAP